MGYYTDYELSVKGDPGALDEFNQVASDRAQTFDDYHPLDYFVRGVEFNAKWYYWKDDMEALSKRFPALLFTIDANGENSGDIWRAYIRNGKIKRIEPELTWPKVDLDKELPAGVVSDEERKARAEAAQRAAAEEEARFERIEELKRQQASLEEEIQTLYKEA